MNNLITFYITLLFFLLSFSGIQAQPINNIVGDVVMPAPNAAALGKYGDIPVSYHTGTPNISVPITSVQSGPLGLAVSLSYHASGIKVGETASWVGTGWSLSAGGMITRSVHGIGDDKPNSGYWYTSGSIDPGSMQSLYDIGIGVLDGEPDIFSFNFAGYSGKFVFDENHDPILIPKQDLKIADIRFGLDLNGIHSMIGFTILDPNGNKFDFGNAPGETSNKGIEMSEFNTTGQGGPPDEGYVSTWYLVKVSSPDDLYEINLDYEDVKYSYTSLASCFENISHSSWVGSNVPFNNGSGGQSGATVIGCIGDLDQQINRYLNKSYINGKRLKTITTPTSSLEFNANTIREDLDQYVGAPTNKEAKQLDNIKLTTGGYCIQWDLSYEYFEDPAFPTRSEYKRLKLTQLQKKSCDSPLIENPYTFHYYTSQSNTNGTQKLINRLSRQIDHWGFYNGALGNDSNPNSPNIPPTNNNDFIRGSSDRETDPSKVKEGVISKIDYPLGGSTTYTFEANNVLTFDILEYDIINRIEDYEQAEGANCLPTNPVSSIVKNLTQDEIDYSEFELKLVVHCDDGDPNAECEDFFGRVTIEIIDVDANPNASMGTHSFTLNCGNGASGFIEDTQIYPLSEISTSLVAGTNYRFAISVENNGNEGTFILRAKIPDSPLDRYVGGLRVTQIRSSTTSTLSSNDIIKTYEYPSESYPSNSSGVLYYEPIYGSVLQGYNNIGSGGPAWIVKYHDAAIVPLGSFDGYHVMYEQVKENHNNNGQKVIKFESFTVSPPIDLLPAAPALFNVNNGKLKEEIVQKSIGVDYGIISKLTNTPKNNNYSYFDGICLKAYIESTGSSPHYSIIYTTYTPRTNWYQIKSTIQELDNVSTTTDYTYNSSDKYSFPTSEEFTNSNGKVHRTEYTYIPDLCGNCDGTDVHSQMVQKNMIATPQKIKTKVSDEIGGGITRNYTLNFDGFPRLEKVYNFEASTNQDGSIGNGTWVLDGTILGYNQGYPSGFHKANWEPESYTWQDGLISGREFLDYTWAYNYIPGTRLVQSITDVDGQSVVYDYDDLMRLSNVNARGGAVTTDYLYFFGDVDNEDYNLVKSTTTIAPTVPESELTERIDYQYIDGLGRLMQTVKANYSPDDKDVVQAVRYDGSGRVIAEYIPVESSGGGGAYFEVPTNTAASTTTYEASPLNRIIAKSPAGGYATLIEYGNNTGDEVLMNLGNGNYPPNELYKKTITDPNNNLTYNYTDKKGRLILSAKPDIDGQDAETYNQYDDKDRLTTVVPPDATVGDAGLIYEYKYDAANNMISKKIPDQAEMIMKYNNRDLMVLSQDGNLAAENKWMLTHYDLYGRPTGTGFYIGANPDPNATLNFSPQHTETSYGNTGIENGKVTLAKTLNLIDGAWLRTEFIYDDFGRVQKQRGNNHINLDPAADVETFSYDNADNIMNQVRTLDDAFDDDFLITQSHTYDHAGRLIDTYHTVGINAEDEIHVSRNFYNARDFVIQKRLNGNDNATFLQYVDYSYNDAGWLTAINNVDAITQNAIQDCDLTPTECGEKCDYTVTTPCTLSEGPYESWSGIIGIYVNGGQLMDLDNYPYTCYDFIQLEIDIENWLDQNNIVYQSVTITANPGPGDGYESLTITILQTNLPFNHVTVDKMYQPTPNSAVDFFFEQSNCTGGNETPPIDICDLCRAKGYDCFKCPYNEMEPPCTVCGELGIQNCDQCDGSGDNCNRCLDLGYQDCETCPLTVDAINPIRLQVDYNVGDVNNGEASMIKVTETSQYFLHNGTSKILSNSQTKVVGSNGTLAADMVNVMDIDLTGNLMTQNNVEAIIATVNNLVEGELNAAGVFGGLNIADFKASVESVLQSNWGDLPTYNGSLANLTTLNPDLFALKISYFEGNPVVESPDYFNGNISSMTWASRNGGIQTFGFWYDELDRLKKAEHRDLIANDDEDKFGATIAYADLRGNIASILRNGVTGTCTFPDGSTAYNFQQIDNIGFTYAGGTNKLTYLSEASDKDHGFKGDGGSLGYDANGNMIGIGYKKLLATYNHLNLPTSFAHQAFGSTIDIGYDASGGKLRKTINDLEDPENNYVKDYLGGVEYKDAELESIVFPEGRITRVEGEYFYEYFLKDHLGNTRIVLSDKNKDGFIQPDGDTYGSEEELLQESHYYPFGMNMEGPWDESVSSPENEYLYNGKELTEGLGLDWLDYGARWYDASIGRWNAVDPLAPAYSSLSPFHYAGNNPVINIDPTGMAFWKSSFLNKNATHWTDDMGFQSGSDRADAENENKEKAKKSKKFTNSLSKLSSDLNAQEGVKAIHLVFQSETSKIYMHTVRALAAGFPALLHIIKGNPSLRDENRKNALRGYPSGDPSPDEYPYASTYEGGTGASVMYVPLSEQRTQGGRLSILSMLLNDRDPFLVVPISTTDELDQVLKSVRANKLSLSNTSASRGKKAELRARAIFRVITLIPSRAANRIFPIFYDDPSFHRTVPDNKIY